MDHYQWMWPTKIQVHSQGLHNGLAERFINDPTDRLQESGLVNRSDLMSQDE